jgi:hypothetical protein
MGSGFVQFASGDKAMKTAQGWGWLVAGVLALGLNGMYQDGGAAWAHRVADRVVERTGVLADLASERVDGLMGRANLVAAREETASCGLATAMARFQTKMARTQNGLAHFEAMSARQEAALARVEGERARMEAQTVRLQIATGVMVRAMKVPVACPRVHVSVPRLPMVRIPARVVRVEMPGGGPI